VEEGKGEDEHLQILGLVFVTLEELLTTYGVSQVRASQVGLQTLGRLVGHFDTVLQDGSGELIRGV
jgi:hypothetical protein